MIFEISLLVLGLILLIKGADILVDNSSKIAQKFGISKLVIGLTIVAFGTSLPELIVNISSSISGSPQIAIGNIIGSNISNTLLILGIIGLIHTIIVRTQIVQREIPYNIFASLFLLIFCLDTIFENTNYIEISRTEGLTLIMLFGIFLYYLYFISKEELENIEEIKSQKIWKNLILIIIGGSALFLGGKLTVDSSIYIAKYFGISEYLISATIIAVGTSLPELITSIIAIIKKETSISLGNIIGSNVFNIFLILGISSMINPIIIGSEILFDVIILTLSSILILIFMFIFKKKEIGKIEGIILISIYIIYTANIVIRG